MVPLIQILKVHDRLDGGLGVQSVEDGLHQEEVDPALVQGQHLFAIGVVDLIESHAPRAGIVHVGREGKGAIERPDGPGQEARLVRLGGGPAVGALATETGCGEVDVAHRMLQCIIGLADRGGVEGVGLADVGAGREIGVVQLGHEVGAGEAQQIVVALQRMAVILEMAVAEIILAEPLLLEHHAPRAVEHEDSLF
jgi:hypothetical protein